MVLDCKDDILNFSAMDLYFSEFLLKKDLICDEAVKFAVALIFFQSRQGHLCIQCKNGLITPSKPFSAGFLAFIERGLKTISQLIDDGKLKAIIKHKNSYYLHKNWVIESKIVNDIERLQTKPSLLSNNTSFQVKSKNLLDKNLISKEQFSLFEKCIKHSLVFLSGGPGTGKTYTASRLLETIASTTPDLKVIITAPTGKAVSNLQEKVTALKFKFSYQVKTMHALLKLQALHQIHFCNLKLNADLIVVDEASMIDATLLALFLSSIKDGTSVIFMGDQNQLPPIEGGSPFADIIAAKKDLCIFLKQCHRFKNSFLADALREGKCSEFISVITSQNVHQENFFDKRFNTISSDIIALVEERLIVHSQSEIDPEKALERFEKFRILNCVRQGSFGVDAINQALYSFFFKKFSACNFAYPILITENNFQMKLFNGIIGVMLKDEAQENAYFMIENQLKKFPKLALPKYELAFAISVHKSQGSEYENVYIVVPPGSENLGKQVLYTAITRSKEKVKIFGPLHLIEATIGSFEKKISQISQRLKI